jgi:hypothetical protein
VRPVLIKKKTKPWRSQEYKQPSRVAKLTRRVETNRKKRASQERRGEFFPCSSQAQILPDSVLAPCVRSAPSQKVRSSACTPKINVKHLVEEGSVLAQHGIFSNRRLNKFVDAHGSTLNTGLNIRQSRALIQILLQRGGIEVNPGPQQKVAFKKTFKPASEIKFDVKEFKPAPKVPVQKEDTRAPLDPVVAEKIRETFNTTPNTPPPPPPPPTPIQGGLDKAVEDMEAMGLGPGTRRFSLASVHWNPAAKELDFVVKFATGEVDIYDNERNFIENKELAVSQLVVNAKDEGLTLSRHEAATIYFHVCQVFQEHGDAKEWRLTCNKAHPDVDGVLPGEAELATAQGSETTVPTLTPLPKLSDAVASAVATTTVQAAVSCTTTTAQVVAPAAPAQVDILPIWEILSPPSLPARPALHPGFGEIKLRPSCARPVVAAPRLTPAVLEARKKRLLKVRPHILTGFVNRDDPKAPLVLLDATEKQRCLKVKERKQAEEVLRGDTLLASSARPVGRCCVWCFCWSIISLILTEIGLFPARVDERKGFGRALYGEQAEFVSGSVEVVNANKFDDRLITNRGVKRVEQAYEIRRVNYRFYVPWVPILITLTVAAISATPYFAAKMIAGQIAGTPLELVGHDYMPEVRFLLRSVCYIFLSQLISRLLSHISHPNELFLRRPTLTRASYFICALLAHLPYGPSLVVLYLGFYYVAPLIRPLPPRAVAYSPHIVSCLLAEYPRGVDIATMKATLHAKALRLASFPLPDKRQFTAVEVLQGSEEVALYLAANRLFGLAPPPDQGQPEHGER